MNQLQFETSPYLLQHANNPVHWMPWNEETLSKAKHEHKVILVSIGYSACHWCHVMEHESFEDPEIAALMNTHFINIKIDREERPDLDHFFMDAVQLMGISGGWPLHCFLTPDLKPFYGGTYFPPRNAHGRPSWKQVLMGVSTSFNEDKRTVIDQADKLYAYLIQKQGLQSSIDKKDITDLNVHNTCNQIIQYADPTNGGFGQAPKFPHFSSLELLLDYHWYTKHPQALHTSINALIAMCISGTYDQVEGGMCRYAVDAEWNVPHFEKMLYDNALLLKSLSKAFGIIPHPFFTYYIDRTFQYLLQNCKSPDGLFYAAWDADSEGEEGKYYVFTHEEITKQQEITDQFIANFCVNKSGNWEEHKNILRLKKLDLELHIQLDRYFEILSNAQPSLQILSNIRSQRIKPGLDYKCILSWNAMLADALANCYLHTGNPEYLTEAKYLLHSIQKIFKQENETYLRIYSKSQVKQTAFLEDYAFLLAANISVYKASMQEEYLQESKRLLQILEKQYEDSNSGFYCIKSKEEEKHIPNQVETQDQSYAAANAIIIECKRFLALYEDDFAKTNAIKAQLSKLNHVISKYPLAYSTYISTYLYLEHGPIEIEAKVLKSPTLLGIPGLIVKPTDDDIFQLCASGQCFLPTQSEEEIALQLAPQGA